MIDFRSRKAAAMVVVVDFLLAVLLMQQAVLSLSTIAKESSPPNIETAGVYLIKITWSPMDDVDLYVQEPSGDIAFYANRETNWIHLERDDLGADQNSHPGEPHEERAVIRGVVPGEYIVNTHMYFMNSVDPVTVTVELWNLQGRDRRVLVKKVVLYTHGEEKTAFRFVVNSNGQIGDINYLERKMVGDYRSFSR